MNIFAGKQITRSDDKLQKVTLDYVYNALRTPKPEMENLVRNMRIVRTLSVQQYSNLKRQLPYLVCATFCPPYRRKENFAHADCFIIDIDHLQSKGLDIDEVRRRIQADDRVVLCFKSPSEDGLKALFMLGERCTDAGLYSVFYRAFAKAFATRHNLEQAVDMATSDVSRACFMSIDRDAYRNPNATPVNISSYVDTADITAFFDQKRALDKEVREQAHEQAQSAHTQHTGDPERDIMRQIKERLKPTPPTLRPQAYVPEVLDDIIGDLTTHITSLGIEVVEVSNIQYAKKMKFRLGLKQGEINLFYGKRGFSVVQSPRCGTSPELNSLMADVINDYLAQH